MLTVIIIIVAVIVLVIIALAVFVSVSKKKIAKEGRLTEAVIVGIEDNATQNGDGYTTKYGVITTYHVKYNNQQGEEIEADLDKGEAWMKVGDRIQIKYLPSRPNVVIYVGKH